MKKSLGRVVHGVLPLVLVTGFFVAGISGGASCNTYPFVGDNWFISKKHFLEGIPIWQNFAENKLVAQVNHRTIATLLTAFMTWRLSGFMTNPMLTKSARLASGLLLASLWT